MLALRHAGTDGGCRLPEFSPFSHFQPSELSTDLAFTHSCVLEMRKEKSRDAARSRRGKENYEFYELAKLLPLPAAITSQLDKASIIRLSISYLKLRDFSGRGDPPWSREGPVKSPKGGHVRSRSVGVTVGMELFEQHQGTHILQSLDGFAFVLAADGRFLYVSETVSIYLGLSQVEMTGSNVFDYVHHQDHAEMAEQMGINLSPTSGSPSSDDGSSTTGGPSTPTPDRPAPIMTLNSNNMYKGLERVFCIRMKSTLTKRGCHFKSSGYRVVLLLTHLRPQYSFSHSRKNPPIIIGMVALAIALPPPSMNEVRLESDMFVTRLTFDFRIAHCEPRVSELLDYTAEEMTGKNMYLLCHGQDVQKLRQCHIDLIHKGQVMSEYYRVMNKTGGYIWIQTCATIICNNKSSEEQSIICVNYVLSGTEYQNYVMDCSQMRHINKLKLDDPSNSEKDNSLDKEGRDKSIPDNSESITSSPKITQEEKSAENENINGDHLAQLRSNNNCQQHLLGAIGKISIPENSALSFLENKQIHITNETSYEEEKLNNDEISSEDSYPKEQRRKRKLQDLSTSTDTDNKSPKRKSSLETVSVDNGIFIVDGSSNLSDNSERLGMSGKEESCSPISLSGNQTSENNKEVTRPWRRSPNHIYPEISNNLVAPMKDLEETLGRHLPNSSPSRNSSSQEIILRKGYVRSQHSQPVQQSAIQWIGTPQTTLPASTFLRQLYVNRESVIRSGAHPTRPSYYSDVQGTLPTPPSSGTESYTTKTNSESYGIIPNYSSSGSTFMDTCSAMTPPASVSPRDKFHSSTADASAFSEAGISHLRHYVTVDRCADPPLHHLPLKPQVFVHPGSIDASAYNHSHSSPEQQQLYAHHGFHLYHTSGKSSHHPTNGASWYPQPNT